MARMVSLKRPKNDVKNDTTASGPGEYQNPEDEGIAMHFDHHHLIKMKADDGEPLAGRMKSGHRVHFHGEGTVERSETRSGKDGDRHSATIRLHRGRVEHEPSRDDERDDLHEAVEKAYGESAKGK